MRPADIERICSDLAQEAALGTGLRIAGVVYSKEGDEKYLRVFIEKDGGVSIDDCTEISTALGVRLDEIDPIKGGYMLEVSSSGEMPLRGEDDLVRFEGRYAEIRTYKDIDGKRVFEGHIGKVEGKTLLFEVDGEAVEIPLSLISGSRLAVPR